MDSENLPCRYLDMFTIYDNHDGKNKYKLATLDDIGMDGTDIVAVGWVRPMHAWELDGSPAADDDDDDDDDDNSDDIGLDVPGRDGKETDMPSMARANKSRQQQRIRLSSIFSHYQTHTSPSNEPEIWLRTEFAYYKLGTPMDYYERLYTQIYKPFFLSNALIQCASSSPDMSLNEFIQAINSLDEAHKPGTSESHDHEVPSMVKVDTVGNASLGYTFKISDVFGLSEVILLEVNAYVESSENFALLVSPRSY